MPRRDRLSRGDFPATLKTGRRLSSPHFSLVMSGKGHGSAVVVPKSVAKLSVTRHRIKRRVLHALKSLSRRGGALVVFPKAAVATLPYEVLREELATLLSKAGETP